MLLLGAIYSIVVLRNFLEGKYSPSGNLTWEMLFLFGLPLGILALFLFE